MNDVKLRCVVLEDEDDLREWTVNKLKQFDEVEFVGESQSVDDAFRLIASTNPDAAFMDIKLEGGDVFTLLDRLKQSGVRIPNIIIISAFPEYVLTAINDYNKYIKQYLVKPITDNWQEHFRKALDALLMAKLTSFTPQPKKVEIVKEKEITKPDHVFVQNKGILEKIEFESIFYVEAAGSGESLVVVEDEYFQIDLTLNKFLQILPEQFFRISKSCIVNLQKIKRINSGDRTLEVDREKTKELGIGDKYYGDLKSRLVLAKDVFKT